MASPKDYKVGYGRPPKSGQFKPGQSGCPTGRSKGKPNFKTILDKALSAKVRVREGERVREVPILDASIERLLRQSAGGDVRSMKLVWDMIQYTGGFAQDLENSTVKITEADQAVLDAYVARARGRDKEQ